MARGRGEWLPRQDFGRERLEEGPGARPAVIGQAYFPPQTMGLWNMFFLFSKCPKDVGPFNGRIWTCTTQGCLGPQNDASFEGPIMILRVGDFKVPAVKFRGSKD